MMRIDGNPGSNETASIRQLQKAGADRTGASKRQAAATGDRVDLSADAKLARAALQAAGETPGIRQAEVDRVRQKLENGELGNDSRLLADRLIDHLLES